MSGPERVRPRIDAVTLARVLGQPQPTDEQAAVIESALGPAAVVAGAGSGKTETMAARVVWLVANELVAPDEILGLTFTRKAAAELGARIRRRLAQWRRVVERDRPDDVATAGPTAGGRADGVDLRRLRRAAGRRAGSAHRRRARRPAAVAGPAVADRRPRRAALARRAGRVRRHLLARALGDRHLGPVRRPPRRRRLRRAVLRRRAGDRSSPCRSGQRARSETPNGTGDYVKAMRQRRALVPIVREYLQAKQRAGRRRLRRPDAARPPSSRRCPRSPPSSGSATAPCCSTSTRTPGTRRSSCCAGCSAPAIRSPRWATRSSRSTAGAARAPATWAPSTPTSRAADGTPAPVYPLATSFRNDRAILEAANAVARRAAHQPRHRAAAPARRQRPGHGRDHVHRARSTTRRSGWRGGCAPRGTRCRAAPGPRPCSCAGAARCRSLADALQSAGLPVRDRRAGRPARRPPRSSTSWPRCGCSATTDPAAR